MSQTSIITGQHVRLEQTAASLFQRSLAWGIDFFIISFCQLLIFPVAMAVDSITESSNITVISIFLLELVTCAYPLLMEVFNHGQSLGKKVCSIQVVRLDGTEPSLSDYLTRWIFLLVDFFYLLIGMVFIIFTKNSQRLGDLAAGTTVVKKLQYGDLYYDLREFEFAGKNYKPKFEAAAQLTPGQAELIQQSLWIENWDLKLRVQMKLAKKVQEYLNVDMGNMSDVAFLRNVLSDYLHYQSVSHD